jgi:succinate dehydrogenase / fumarate reductase, cytochrome b subunit
MPDASLKKKRPLWYNLSPVNLPAPGLVSILHRISGTLMFVLLAWVLYLFDASLQSAERFEALKATLAHPLAKIVLLGLLWSYMHHLCAGVRFLFLDIEKGVDLPAARTTSMAVIGVSLVLTILFAARWLW